ncbi:MAG: hypothetical protein M1814_005641 [Vezdaea aestivalis]|nr:MAG: hypothetical protein M1814_005641 [Vezdaea aestivalis]
MATNLPKYPLRAFTRQSPPIDFSENFDLAWIQGKTILITGGASGFGSAFLKEFGSLAANVIIGDINVEQGDKVVRETRKETNNNNLHFVHCDVTDWSSQVNFFKQAVKLSPHGGIDVVIANAGIVDIPPTFDAPVGLDGPNPPPPAMRSLDVNLTGVLYTSHLAMFYLPGNPGSKPASPDAVPSPNSRDRQLILVGSLASLCALPGQTLYSVGKHAVLGLFRNLRTTCFTKGMRINMICPYFVDTPLLGNTARFMLAGKGTAKVEDVVSVVARFIGDSRIVGRAAVIGPRMNVKQREDGEWTFVEREGKGSEEVAVWDAYAHDHEDSDAFIRKIIVMMNQFVAYRGWMGWLSDTLAIFSKHVLGRGR